MRRELTCLLKWMYCTSFLSSSLSPHLYARASSTKTRSSTSGMSSRTEWGSWLIVSPRCSKSRQDDVRDRHRSHIMPGSWIQATPILDIQSHQTNSHSQRSSTALLTVLSSRAAQFSKTNTGQHLFSCLYSRILLTSSLQGAWSLEQSASVLKHQWVL